jgi:hypothetical protein
VIPERAEVFAQTSEDSRKRVFLELDGCDLVAQHLDIAGSWFGRAGLIVRKGGDRIRLQEGSRRSARDVARLLQHDEYEHRFLAPREETVAILYVDIAGFTRISETKLKTPAKVAELVETSRAFRAALPRTRSSSWRTPSGRFRTGTDSRSATDAAPP